ncbi:hypothetical protein ABH931_001804 [Streptacidiphilus sp. MAP12-33]|uniref:YcxB family protein n=1 Tax=Streptacidiphilus sp. MAP12-33 TaxID=3156266 RepID=UPI0035143157
MDIEAEFEYQHGERRARWLRTAAWIPAFWIAVGLAGLVVAFGAKGMTTAHLTLLALSALLVGTHVQAVVRRVRLLSSGEPLSLRFTEAGLSWRNQFVSHQVRWPAVRRVRRDHGWLIFEGTRSVGNVSFPMRALSEVQLEQLTAWLTAQRLMR